MRLSITTLETGPPTVFTGAAQNEISSIAILNGTVSANGLSTTAWFDYGMTSGSYGSISSTKTVVGTKDTSVSISISGLSGGTNYYYRLAAKNSAGTTYGNEKTFTTTTKTVSTIPRVSCGRDHSLALKSNSAVWAWGYNKYGQLGDGTTTNSATPVQVSGLSGFTAIASGGLHSIALKSDGTVWAWGANWYGQLGDGTTTNSTTPVQVSGLSGIIAIAGGWQHSTALKSDGTVWAWGINNYGQLGNGTTTNSVTPVQVSGLSNVTAIACGELHSIALKSDGTVWAWGINDSGQLGDESTINRITPVQVNLDLGQSSIDSVAPMGSIVINRGASFANSTAVTLALSAVDTFGVTEYYLSTSLTTPSVSTLDWTSVSSTTFYSGNISYILDSVDGTKTVYAWYKDATGNISNKASDSIILDTTAPTITISSPTSNSTYSTTSSTISLSGSASDSGSGISSVTWSNSKGGSGTASGTTSWSVSNISLSSGENVITVTATDGVGYTGTDTITVTYTTSTRPTPTATATPIPSTSPTPSSIPTPTSTCTDDYEPNDSFSTAYGHLVSQSSYSGKICSPFDDDYFKINVASPGIISLILNIPPDKDYDLYLYDSNQSMVAFSIQGFGVPEAITYFANTPGTYYIWVFGYGSFDENQTYTLLGTWETTATAAPTVIPTPSGICEAESMEVSKTRLVLRKGRSRKVTVSVKGIIGCPVEGIETEATVNDGGKLISVSPVIQATDEGGEAVFTITAKNRTGEARITFNAGNLEKTLNVKVRR